MSIHYTMRILFISNDLIGGNLAYLLTQEGHEVKLYIKERARRSNFTGLVTQTLDWKKELGWVGKEGLIVFDDAGYGKIQDALRKKGYTVFGGSELGEKLETDREYGQKIFAENGLQTTILKDFKSLRSAIDFIRQNPRAWVIKQNDDAPKNVNYVGSLADGSDVIDMLESYRKTPDLRKKIKLITLHERIFGVEIGVGRYFNGTNWVGPIEMNIEHKKFLAGDLGPTTSEMGTLAWYDDNEDNPFFKKALKPFEKFLREVNFRGDFEINCIVNKDGIFPLEATSRMGSPIIHLHSELHKSPWGEFLHAVASGKDYNLKWKKGMGIVVLVAVPPFPYAKMSKYNRHQDTKIHFKEIQPADFEHIHFEEVSKREVKGTQEYYISDNRGYVLYTTAVGKTIEEAQKKVYALTEKIVIPKMLYRNDIGTRFKNRDLQRLKDWGYDFGDAIL